MSIASADPDHADVEELRAARPDLPGRMDAERKRDVAEIAGADALAGERAAPGQLGEAQVVARARIEYRLPGRAARAPIFRDLGAGNRAERRQELGVSELAQGVLVQDGDLPPLEGIVERIGVDVVELAAIPWDGLRARERCTLALALDLRDVGTGLGQRERQRHGGHTCVCPGLAARYCCTRSAFMTLRVGVIGISATTARCSGQVNFANLRSARNALSSSKLNDAPGLRITKHAARSVSTSSGKGAIATFATAG